MKTSVIVAFVTSFVRLNRILWKYGYAHNFQDIVGQMLLLQDEALSSTWSMPKPGSGGGNG